MDGSPAARTQSIAAALLNALALVLALLWGLAAAQAEVPIKRIGYLEAGPFWLFDDTWAAFRTSLGRNEDFRYVFPADARISPGWEPAQMQTLAEHARRLMARDDLDLVVGMGTAAVRALLNANTGRMPILGMGMADPIAAKVVASAEDSGVDNFTCPVTVDRWPSMFRVFYDVVRFRKLGVMYADTVDGRVYASLDAAEAIAEELGFSLVRYGGLSSAESPEECIRGLDVLHEQGIDAFFIGPLNCFDINGKALSPLLSKLGAWKIPTFARDGSSYVKAGALMGFSTWNFAPTGDFLAAQAHAILAGASPRSLSMIDQVEPSIALNLAVAKAIGFEFPFDVLVAADELYETVTPPSAGKP